MGIGLHPVSIDDRAFSLNSWPNPQIVKNGFINQGKMFSLIVCLPVFNYTTEWTGKSLHLARFVFFNMTKIINNQLIVSQMESLHFWTPHYEKNRSISQYCGILNELLLLSCRSSLKGRSDFNLFEKMLWRGRGCWRMFLRFFSGCRTVSTF